MEFAKQQAIKNAQAVVPNDIENKERAVVVWQNKPSLPAIIPNKPSLPAVISNKPMLPMIYEKPTQYTFTSNKDIVLNNGSVTDITDSSLNFDDDYFNFIYANTGHFIQLTVNYILNDSNTMTEMRRRTISDPHLYKELELMKEKHLLRLGNSDYRTTPKFHELLENSLLKQNNVFINKNYLRNLVKEGIFSANISEVDEYITVLLAPIQSHVTITCVLINRVQILWGYLTSEPETTNIFLSKTQPFGDKAQKPQYLHILSKPMIISDKLIKPSSVEFLKQQTDYLNNPDIFPIFENAFRERGINKFYNALEVYDDEGISLTKLAEVHNAFNAECERNALHYFNLKYERSRQLGDEELHSFMEKCRINRPHKYPYLVKKVNKYNKENNYAERYYLESKNDA